MKANENQIGNEIEVEKYVSPGFGSQYAA